MRLLRLERADLSRWQDELEALEQRSVYPLGDDAFRISHGADYFAFFERLGEISYYAMEHEGRLVGVLCGILRPAEDGLPRRWYAVDVKVHPDFRGQHVLVSMLYRAFGPCYLRCQRGYAIAMDPPGGREPPAVRAIRHFPWLERLGTDAFGLDFFSADADQTQALLPTLVALRPDQRPRFVSTIGIKDLVLESSGQPYPLLHLSFSDRPAPRVFFGPQPGHAHMWCVPHRHPLVAQLAERGMRPSATATVVRHRLPELDHTYFETSEI